MPGMIDRIIQLGRERKQSLHIDLREYENHKWAAIIQSYRLLAVSDYVETKDIGLFRQNLKIAVDYQIDLFKRSAAGERISGSFVTLENFKEILMALAAGNWEQAYELTQIMNKIFLDPKSYKRDYWEAYVYNIDRFNKLFFEVLSSFILKDMPENSEAIEKMLDYFSQKKKAYVGYALVFQAIYEKDEEKLEKAFIELFKGHKLLCRSGKEFGDSEDEVICIWGLGMANLARFKGLNPRINSPFIPPELLIPLPSQ